MSLPVGPTAQVHDAWRLHYGLTRRALARAYYQGWDMHPGHLPTRYAAVYAFYREGLDAGRRPARPRTRPRPAATCMDEPATARALSGYLLRGLDCGALDDDEVTGPTGLTRADLEALALRGDPRLIAGLGGSGLVGARGSRASGLRATGDRG